MVVAVVSANISWWCSPICSVICLSSVGFTQLLLLAEVSEELLINNGDLPTASLQLQQLYSLHIPICSLDMNLLQKIWVTTAWPGHDPFSLLRRRFWRLHREHKIHLAHHHPALHRSPPGCHVMRSAQLRSRRLWRVAWLMIGVFWGYHCGCLLDFVGDCLCQINISYSWFVGKERIVYGYVPVKHLSTMRVAIIFGVFKNGRKHQKW